MLYIPFLKARIVPELAAPAHGLAMIFAHGDSESGLSVRSGVVGCVSRLSSGVSAEVVEYGIGGERRKRKEERRGSFIGGVRAGTVECNNVIW